MSPMPKRFSLLACLAACLLLVSCLGTEVKKLGGTEPGGDGTPATDADSFSLTIAYRNDTNPSDGRVVVLQGVRDIPSASLVNLCGTTGAACRCTFYTSVSDSSPVVGELSQNGISQENNTFSCELPATLSGTNTVDDYKRVRLTTVDGTKATGFLEIKTSITLTDVLGTLPTNGVRAIYHFGCARTFFEGEGVGLTELNCPAGQRLGLITATYSAYIYKGATGSNEVDKQSNTFWEGSVCSRTSPFPKFTCDTTAQQIWGLYSTKQSIFQYGITMKPQFDDAGKTGVYGYAAGLDSKGRCPLGLVPAWPWVARPPSIIAGSLNNGNPPSNFVQVTTGDLDNTRIELAQPGNFVVQRQPSANHCDGTGSCLGATFGGVENATQTTYVRNSPGICVIPKELLTGIF